MFLKQNDGTELQKVENGNLLVNELGTTNKEENVKSIYLIVIHAVKETNFRTFFSLGSRL